VNRVCTALFLLLVAQLGIYAWLVTGEQLESAALESRTLLDVNASLVDRIRVEDGEGGEAELHLHAGHWVLPEYDNLPADDARIANLLEQFTAVDPGWPVAHTHAARQRFQVAPYLFQRRITLYNDERELGSVFLGTSPGFRKIHARAADVDPIYSLELDQFNLPATAEGWLDAELLRVRAPLRITADGYSLDMQTGEWRLGSGKAPDKREMQALLEALRHLRVTGIATPGEATAAEATEADLILQVLSVTGEATLEFYTLDDAHFVRSSVYPQLFRLSDYQFDKLIGIDSFLLSGAQ